MRRACLPVLSASSEAHIRLWITFPGITALHGPEISSRCIGSTSSGTRHGVYLCRDAVLLVEESPVFAGQEDVPASVIHWCAFDPLGKRDGSGLVHLASTVPAVKRKKNLGAFAITEGLRSLASLTNPAGMGLAARASQVTGGL
jgi:hypothetical protein